MESNSQYKYFAFISYNSKDTEWGKKMQRKLEGYRMPATLCREHNWERKPYCKEDDHFDCEIMN